MRLKYDISLPGLSAFYDPQKSLHALNSDVYAILLYLQNLDGTGNILACAHQLAEVPCVVYYD